MVGRQELQEIDEHLPDKDIAREFYAKYEPKEVLGRLEPFLSGEFRVVIIDPF